MCGRYTLRDPKRCFAEFSILEKPAALEPRFNIAPSQGVWALRVTPPSTRPELHLLRWGFELQRQGEFKETVMARAETLLRPSSFDDALVARRCLLLADGFYEWKRTGGASIPHFMQRPGGAPFAMAGIWQPAAARAMQLSAGSLSADGCAVITRPARAPVTLVHGRMPVVLAPRHHSAWLDPSFDDRSALARMLFADPGIELEMTAVGTRVNATDNDDESCVMAATEAIPEQLALFSGQNRSR
ncbi:MAG TPA: SOS response-associated peptidase [Polyangiaceae bacterium]|jgi:putative SOS response-associated peptidase YedK